MQTLEGVWENSHKLLSSPKLPLMFASAYVNTASVLYFLNTQKNIYERSPTFLSFSNEISSDFNVYSSNLILSSPAFFSAFCTSL